MPKQRQQQQQQQQQASTPAAAANMSSSHKKTTPKRRKVMVVPPDAESSATNPSIPRSFIFRRGAVAPSAVQLIADLRLMMQPNSALKLEERKNNTMKDFLMVGPQLGVSHFLCFTQSEVGLNMRIIRIPHGPTLTFRVVSYCTQRDIVNIQKHPHSPATEYHHPPLVVLNNFNATAAATNTSTAASGDTNKQPTYSHLPLLAVVLQHMFPPLHLPTLLLSHCRRVVLFHFDPETQLIDMRHYLIQAKPTGLTKPIQKVVQGKLVDLGSLDDISQYIHQQQQQQTMMTSDSEADNNDAANAVVLPERYVGRGNRPTHRSAIRLHELGPRMTLSLLKIEENFCGGRVLYHHYLTKSPEEQQAMRLKKEQKKREKEERRREQERNVQRKTGGQAEHREQQEDEYAEEMGSSSKKASSSLSGYDDDEFGVSAGLNVANDDLNEDEQWYEREVGEKPGPEVFGRSDVNRSHRPALTDASDIHPDKKPRVDGEEKHRRVGGRRAGAGPRKPWIRGRGGMSAGSAGATNSRGRGSIRGRGR